MPENLGRAINYYFKEGTTDRDWDKIYAGAREGDLLAIELVWVQSFDAWDEYSRRHLRTSGRQEGLRLGGADAEADEALEDKNEIKALALKAFEDWWKGQEQLYNSMYGVWPVESINPDLNEIQRVFKTGFVEAYIKSAEKVRKGEAATFQAISNELPDLFAVAKAELEEEWNAKEPPDPKSLRPSFDANDYTPTASYGASAIKEIATAKGTDMAVSHYPHAVIEDIRQLRIFARDMCADWWSGLSNKEYNNAEFPEMRRIFVSTFMKAYMETVDSKSGNPGRWTNTQEPEQEDVIIRIRTQNQIGDGITYAVEFLDSERMSKSVWFYISVQDDGAVEVEA